MFNGILKSDDVEVYEPISTANRIMLSDSCKANIIIAASNNQLNYIQLPNNSFIGKIISITQLHGVNGTDKASTDLTTIIQHSNTTLFTIRQGTVSFMYVGQQLNGLTATDKAKSGWIILGGVQGDTAITGYAGSVAIGSGSYGRDTNSTSIGGASSAGYYGTAIGSGSTATGSNGSVAIGAPASAAGAYGIGIGNSSSAANADTIAIGRSTNSNASNAIAIGLSASVGSTSRIALKSNPQFSTAGDAQAGKFILMRQTTDATPLVMSATNAAASTANILILPNNGTYGFKGIVVAKDATTLDSAMWEVTALMKRGANASTTALVGTPTVTKVFNDAGAAAWTIALTADTTNGGGAITVTGEAGKTIRWVSNIDSAEVI